MITAKQARKNSGSSLDTTLGPELQAELNKVLRRISLLIRAASYTSRSVVVPDPSLSSLFTPSETGYTYTLLGRYVVERLIDKGFRTKIDDTYPVPCLYISW